MEELKQRLMAQAGLDDEQSQQAIEVTLEYIKEQLPEGLRGMVDNLVAGGGGGSDPLAAVKGLFGG